MTGPTDAELDSIDMDAKAIANQNPIGTPFAWRKAYLTSLARAVLAKWGAQPVERAPLSDEKVDSLCKVGPVYAPDGRVTRTPPQYRDELEAAQRYGLRKGERAHGIKKGGQHGAE